MKKFIVFAALAASLSILGVSCDKNGTDEETKGVKDALVIQPATATRAGNGLSGSDGTLIYPIGSVFVGGGVADPSKGSSHRCHFYTEKFTTGPLWDEVQALVTIYGFRYKGVEYTKPGQYIDSIILAGLDESLGLGSVIYIPMEQGVYKGGNDLVKSVDIKSYKFASYSDYSGTQNKDSDINIVITTKAGDKITLLFTNDVTPYDGYY